MDVESITCCTFAAGGLSFHINRVNDVFPFSFCKSLNALSNGSLFVNFLKNDVISLLVCPWKSPKSDSKKSSTSGKPLS